MTSGGKSCHDYVCHELRDRIAEWLITRRHYRRGSLHSMDTVKRMNGIEFDHFTIGWPHKYEALFLSGMDPEADPHGLDPWWKQNWNDTRLPGAGRLDHQQLGANLLHRDTAHG